MAALRCGLAIVVISCLLALVSGESTLATRTILGGDFTLVKAAPSYETSSSKFSTPTAPGTQMSIYLAANIQSGKFNSRTEDKTLVKTAQGAVFLELNRDLEVVSDYLAPTGLRFDDFAFTDYTLIATAHGLIASNPAPCYGPQLDRGSRDPGIVTFFTDSFGCLSDHPSIPITAITTCTVLTSKIATSSREDFFVASIGTGGCWDPESGYDASPFLLLLHKEADKRAEKVLFRASVGTRVTITAMYKTAGASDEAVVYIALDIKATGASTDTIDLLDGNQLKSTFVGSIPKALVLVAKVTKAGVFSVRPVQFPGTVLKVTHLGAFATSPELIWATGLAGSQLSAAAVFATTLKSTATEMPVRLDWISANDMIDEVATRVIGASVATRTLFLTFEWESKENFVVSRTKTDEVVATPVNQYAASTISTIKLNLDTSATLTLNQMFGVTSILGARMLPEEKVNSSQTLVGSGALNLEQRLYSFVQLDSALAVGKESRLVGQYFVTGERGAQFTTDAPPTAHIPSPPPALTTPHSYTPHTGSDAMPDMASEGSLTKAWIFVGVVLAIVVGLGYFAWRYWAKQKAALSNLERANKAQQPLQDV